MSKEVGCEFNTPRGCVTNTSAGGSLSTSDTAIANQAVGIRTWTGAEYEYAVPVVFSADGSVMTPPFARANETPNDSVAALDPASLFNLLQMQQSAGAIGIANIGVSGMPGGIAFANIATMQPESHMLDNGYNVPLPVPPSLSMLNSNGQQPVPVPLGLVVPSKQPRRRRRKNQELLPSERWNCVYGYS